MANIKKDIKEIPLSHTADGKPLSSLYTDPYAQIINPFEVNGYGVNLI